MIKCLGHSIIFMISFFPCIRLTWLVSLRQAPHNFLLSCNADLQKNINYWICYRLEWCYLYHFLKFNYPQLAKFILIIPWLSNLHFWLSIYLLEFSLWVPKKDNILFSLWHEIMVNFYKYRLNNEFVTYFSRGQFQSSFFLYWGFSLGRSRRAEEWELTGCRPYGAGWRQCPHDQEGLKNWTTQRTHLTYHNCLSPWEETHSKLQTVSQIRFKNIWKMLKMKVLAEYRFRHKVIWHYRGPRLCNSTSVTTKGSKLSQEMSLLRPLESLPEKKAPWARDLVCLAHGQDALLCSAF